MDVLAQETKLAVEDMRMQIQTQLDPTEIEHLFLDNYFTAQQESEDQEINEFGFRMNLRTINQYNLELLKERMRGFTESVFQQVHS